MIACESEMFCFLRFLLFRCAFCRVSFVCVPSCVCACVHVSVRVYTRDKTQMCTSRHSEYTYTAHTLHTHTHTHSADLMEVAVKAMASINWFVDTEVQNKARELKGIAIVRTVRNAHPNHTVIQSTCNEILARIDAPQVPSLEDEDLYN